MSKNLSLAEKLAKLEYLQEWIDFCFLSIELLDAQILDMQITGDNNTEHYRYASFRKWLYSQKNITTQQIDNYIFLAQNDSDKLMGGAALVDLLKSEKLSDAEFIYLVNKIDNGQEWIAKHIFKSALLRNLNQSKLSDSEFDTLISKGDSSIHLLLLEHSDVSKERMSVLAEYGASKKVRNIALAKVNSLTFWTKQKKADDI